MSSRQVILVALAALSVAVTGVRAGTTLGDCTHNSHCEPHSCCFVGFMRYSIPTCSPRAAVGEPCSPAYSTPSSRTLHYPNNIMIEVEEAYSGMCPCRTGLICTSGTCQVPGPDSTSSYDDNSISSDYE